MPLEQAVDLAMERLGASNPHTIAQLACSLAYPAGCTAAETKLVYDRVIARLGSSWADIPPPTEPVHTPLVDQVASWLSGLSQAQRDGLRDILGPEHYDPLVAAVEAGDGVALDAEVIRLRALGEDLYENDKVTALMKYGQLQSLLGSKLNDLVALFM